MPPWTWEVRTVEDIRELTMSCAGYVEITGENKNGYC